MPPRRRGRKPAAKKTQPPVEDTECDWIDVEVERESAAMKAMLDVEKENLLTSVRLLRSSLGEEKLQTTAGQFFKEHLPNLLIKQCGNEGRFDVKWRDRDGNVCVNRRLSENELNASLLRRISMAYPDLGGCEFSSKTVKSNFLDADALNIGKIALKEPFDTQVLGMPETFCTPGASSQRLSVGMTPKSVRSPKHGEMLLSVRGSPLGVYKEDNMEAIQEAEED